MSLDHDADLVKQQTPTCDAFLGGRLQVSQPGHGFRAGLDSVLLGAAVAPSAGSLLDLGAGVGAAALVALAHHASRTATLVERDADTLALAAHNLSANGFAARARAVALDVTARGAERSAAGIPADHFASVIANPPFFDPGAGTTPAAARAAARHMQPADLDRWVRAAATHAAPGGETIFIHAAASLPLLLAAFDRRFGAVTVLPLCPRPGTPAARVLVRGIKGSRAPLTLLASRVLHAEAGRGFLPEFDDIFRGHDRLHW
ncbi:MAG TPA: methyltransferase [Devosiaceae bacterium]|jgi:tRNA1(Val) A37 N6-methylase TrmN6|nr:methyltransferase [Devosiaceae bacterium]